MQYLLHFNNMEQMQAIISACVETKSPVILQVSSGAEICQSDNSEVYGTGSRICKGVGAAYRSPHLDHGDTLSFANPVLKPAFHLL